MDFSYLTLLFFVLVLLAEILGTVSGFGSSLFFVPIASAFFDFHTALALTAALHIMSNLSKITLFRKGIDYKIILRVGIPSVVFVVIGSLLTNYVDTKFFELAMAITLIALSILFFFLPKIILKPTWTNSLIGGGIAGFLAGFIGTGGAIRGLLLAAFQLEKNAFVANSAFIDLGVDSARGIVYFSSGYFKKELLFMLPILLVISFCGTYIGKKVLNKIKEEIFKKIVLVLVLATGVFSLLKALSVF